MTTRRSRNCSKNTTNTDFFFPSVSLFSPNLAARLAASLDALSPLKVLGRGYSLARTGAGEILSSVDQVENEDVFTLRLSDGTLDCRVEGKRRQ